MRMEYYQLKLKDKVKLKKDKIVRLMKGNIEKPDGVKIIWHTDGKKEIIK